MYSLTFGYKFEFFRFRGIRWMKKNLGIVFLLVIFFGFSNSQAFSVELRSVNILPQLPGACGLAAMQAAEQLVAYGQLTVDENFLDIHRGFFQQARANRGYFDEHGQETGNIHLRYILARLQDTFSHTKNSELFAVGGGVNETAIGSALGIDYTTTQRDYRDLYLGRWTNFLQQNRATLVALFLAHEHFWVAKLEKQGPNIFVDIYNSSTVPEDEWNEDGIRNMLNQTCENYSSVEFQQQGLRSNFFNIVTGHLRWVKNQNDDFRFTLNIEPLIAQIPVRNCMNAVRISTTSSSSAASAADSSGYDSTNETPSPVATELSESPIEEPVSAGAAQAGVSTEEIVLEPADRPGQNKGSVVAASKAPTPQAVSAMFYKVAMTAWQKFRNFFGY